MKTLNTYKLDPSEGLERLLVVLAEALADAGDDRIAEGGDRRVWATEVYLQQSLAVDLLRERLTDGSHVYNLRFRVEEGC